MPPRTERPAPEAPDKMDRAPACAVGRTHRRVWLEYRNQLEKAREAPAAPAHWRPKKTPRKRVAQIARMRRARLFNQLADRWQRETALESIVTRKAMHPAYQRIIGMGDAAVPLILQRLQREPRQWFWALSAITGEDPAVGQDSAAGAAAAWIEWGKAHDLL
jgi:hypothetical protein